MFLLNHISLSFLDLATTLGFLFSLLFLSLDLRFFLKKYIKNLNFLPLLSSGLFFYFLLFHILRFFNTNTADAIFYFKVVSILIILINIIIFLIYCYSHRSKKEIVMKFGIIGELPLISILLLIFVFFFYIGPYHEYPSDPVQHLLLISKCFFSKSLKEIPITHFSYFFTLVLIGKIDFTSHYLNLSFYSALVQTTLFFLFYKLTYVISKNKHVALAGAIFSLGYFGTNVFSFYRYYTFAKTFFAYIAFLEAMIILVESMRMRRLSVIFFSFPLIVFCIFTHMQEALLICMQMLIAPIIMSLLVDNHNKELWTRSYYHKMILFPFLGIITFQYILKYVKEQNEILLPEFVLRLDKFFHFMPSKMFIINFLPNSSFFKTVGLFGLFTFIFIGLAFILLLLQKKIFSSLDNANKEKNLTLELVVSLALPSIIILFCPLTIFILGKIISQNLFYRLLYGSCYWIMFPIVLHYVLTRYSILNINNRLKLFWFIVFLLLSISYYPQHPVWGRSYMLTYKMMQEHDGRAIVPLVNYINSNEEFKKKVFISDGYTEVFSAIHGIKVLNGQRFLDNPLLGCYDWLALHYKRRIFNAHAIKKSMKGNNMDAAIINMQISDSELGRLSGHWKSSELNLKSKYDNRIVKLISKSKIFSSVKINENITIRY